MSATDFTDDEPVAVNDNLAERRAIRDRVRLVAEVLSLPKAEARGACRDGLMAFSRRHKQSLDWLCDGDVVV